MKHEATQQHEGVYKLRKPKRPKQNFDCLNECGVIYEKFVSLLQFFIIWLIFDATYLLKRIIHLYVRSWTLM